MSYEFSSAPKYGGHCVCEMLFYEKRAEEGMLVVKALEYRSKKRRDAKGMSSDKTLNPLIVIPGSPGSGHFFRSLPRIQ